MTHTDSGVLQQSTVTYTVQYNTKKQKIIIVRSLRSSIINEVATCMYKELRPRSCSSKSSRLRLLMVGVYRQRDTMCKKIGHRTQFSRYYHNAAVFVRSL